MSELADVMLASNGAVPETRLVELAVESPLELELELTTVFVSGRSERLERFPTLFADEPPAPPQAAKTRIDKKLNPKLTILLFFIGNSFSY